MILTLAVVAVVSGALLVGALWGVYGRLGAQTEGFLIALAGGALLFSLVSELIEPSLEASSLWIVSAATAAGATVFTVVDYLVDEKWKAGEGYGLLIAISLDGIPENLALGVALIGAGLPEVAALAGSILLSNLPEAAGGAKGMAKGGMPRRQVLLIWGLTALLLSLAAVIGNVALEDASSHTLAIARCFAAGAVVASLATEVFPKAFKEDHHLAGLATALGLLLALGLSELAKT